MRFITFIKQLQVAEFFYEFIHGSVTSQSARSIQVVSLITMMAERLEFMNELMKDRLKLVAQSLDCKMHILILTF